MLMSFAGHCQCPEKGCVTALSAKRWHLLLTRTQRAARMCKFALMVLQHMFAERFHLTTLLALEKKSEYA